MNTRTHTHTHTHIHVHKCTVGSLQAYGDTFQVDTLTPEDLLCGVGALRMKELGLPAMSNIVTWKRERESTHTKL